MTIIHNRGKFSAFFFLFCRLSNLKTACIVLLRFPCWRTCVWNVVQQATFEVCFSHLVGVSVSQVLPNHQWRVYKLRRIKKAVRTVDPTNVLYKCVHCSLVSATLEDIFVTLSETVSKPVIWTKNLHHGGR